VVRQAHHPELVVRQAHHPELGRRAEGGRIEVGVKVIYLSDLSAIAGRKAFATAEAISKYWIAMDSGSSHRRRDVRNDGNGGFTSILSYLDTWLQPYPE